MNTRVVIVGSGQSGTTVATTLRDRGFTGAVTIVGTEVHLPYERPPLSKQFLTAETDTTNLDLRPATYYEDRDIELVLGHTVISIDLGAHTAALDDGRALGYTTLVLATGTRPVIPEVAGTDLAGVHVLRTVDDAAALREQLASSRHVTTVGGGFIGLELSAAAQKKGIESCVLDIADRVLQRAVSPITSDYLADWHRERGTSVRLGTGMIEIVGTKGRVEAVRTTAGEHIRTDTVVLAVGVRANTELAERAGLVTRNGVVVDEYLRTSDPSVFAVGDCANFPDNVSGLPIRIESVQAATDHARAVALQIIGDQVGPYASVPWFWSNQGSMKLQIAGYTQCSDTDVVRGDPKQGKFSVFRFLDGHLRAVESINRPADHVTARRLLALGDSPTPESITTTTDLRSLVPLAAATA
ncbi:MULTISPECIES: NAD(P)/FAD-dependent oxidoreductase [unclassified Rhodococcus (in: high G+C Gram-positive bacteria)]|uniref:NAD(P)/FAD-dependent oxidoreductase n=1 Tax=unclassified Rhodococcus (in: high G+C Gram-positive bacteria) TaxID=192944 RepID=UPI0015C62728|nr:MULTISPECIES: FAD-dependent oxidoreductase [unclassified Rhodococcus (in: high G+C Gram-positive bacteria)]